MSLIEEIINLIHEYINKWGHEPKYLLVHPNINDALHQDAYIKICMQFSYEKPIPLTIIKGLIIIQTIKIERTEVVG